MAKRKQTAARRRSTTPNSQGQRKGTTTSQDMGKGSGLATSEEQPKDTTTFSIRLTEEQRDLLTKAAELRGWTPTNLIRTATLEKALHILNTSQRTNFNFKGLASEIADHLFKKRTVQANFPDVEPYLEDEYGNPTFRVEPEELPIGKLNELSKAARLGGGEFLNLIVDFCESLTASGRSDLPEPIDPLNVGS